MDQTWSLRRQPPSPLESPWMVEVTHVFRQRSFDVALCPIVPRSRTGGCHSALATGHRVLCQQFWDGDLPGLFGPETAVCLIELGAAPSALLFHHSGGGGKWAEYKRTEASTPLELEFNYPNAK